MASHFLTRVVTAATAALVRKVVPAVVTSVKAMASLFALSAVAGLALIGVHIAHNHGVPGDFLKVIAVAIVLVACLFALVVVAEQVRITYAKPTEAVYPDVEVFPDREPV